jgi:hypothetical protein
MPGLIAGVIAGSGCRASLKGRHRAIARRVALCEPMVGVASLT